MNASQAGKEIAVSALTTCEAAADGSVRLTLIDRQGEAARVIVPADCLPALAATVSRLASDGACAGQDAPSFRGAHSIRSWCLERGADGMTVVLSIETGDSQHISFTMPERDLVSLCDSVSEYEIEAFSPQIQGH